MLRAPRRPTAIIVAAGLFASAAVAEPADWTVDEGASSLGFLFLIDGAQRRGAFTAFEGEARFDPDAMEDAEMTFIVTVESVDAGDPFGTSVVKTNDWLSAYDHPEARYVLQSLTPFEGGGYSATGILTMKDVALPVESTLDITFEDGVVRSKGGIAFDRSAFNIGVGFTALFVEVGDEIVVEFDLVARPKE